MTTSKILSLSMVHPSHSRSSSLTGHLTRQRKTDPLRKMAGEGRKSPSVSLKPLGEHDETSIAGRGESTDRMSWKLCANATTALSEWTAGLGASCVHALLLGVHLPFFPRRRTRREPASLLHHCSQRSQGRAACPWLPQCWLSCRKRCQWSRQSRDG